MSRAVLSLLLLLANAAPAHAQSWVDGQQAYHEKLNAEVELFQQRQEMERMRQDNERDMREQQREIEQQRYELERMRDDQDSTYYRY